MVEIDPWKPWKLYLTSGENDTLHYNYGGKPWRWDLTANDYGISNENTIFQLFMVRGGNSNHNKITEIGFRG